MKNNSYFYDIALKINDENQAAEITHTINNNYTSNENGHQHIDDIFIVISLQQIEMPKTTCKHKIPAIQLLSTNSSSNTCKYNTCFYFFA